MKTNVVLTRKMGEFDVLQRTSDGYFDGNALLTQWNKTPNNPERKMVRFREAQGTVDFINVLSSEESHSAKMHYGVFQPIKEMKGRSTKNGKTKDCIWMHPYLFIKFAMWLNPNFEYYVIKFVHDQLISNRHLAGDNYNKLTAQAYRFADVDYSQLGEALNWIIFNKHYKNIRNDATPGQLQELHELEGKLAFLISEGFVKDFQSLISTMRKLYSDRYRKF